MSQIHANSPKHCAQKKGFPLQKLNLKKNFLCTFSTFLLSLLSLIFLVWLILHPTKPQFSLKQADIYQLNLSSSTHLLTSSIQTTLLSNNPNKKVGIYYDNLLIYASYRGQQITLDSSVPPFYQGCEESNLLSAFLAANGLPVAPSFGYEVERDQSAGKLVLKLKANGNLRWKVGTWVSGKYRFTVNCVAIIIVPFGTVLQTSSLSSKLGTAQCSTSI